METGSMEVDSTDSGKPAIEEKEIKNEVMDEEDTKEIKNEVMDEEDTKEVKDDENTEEVKDDENTKEVKKVVPNAKESNIGISEFIGEHTGFFGIIKQRYSDFVVNEVTSGGEEVHLTDQTIIPAPEVVAEMPDECPPELTPTVMQHLYALAGIPQPARIPLDCPSKEENGVGVTDDDKALIVKKNEVLINVNNASKEGRTNIHRSVKALFNNSLVSCYKENDFGDKFILVQKKKGGGGSKIPKRNNWPKDRPHTTFVLYKENIDTIDAINHLSIGTGLKPNMFAYAGTKDRRAKTSQMVSAPRVAPERLVAAAKHRPIHLGNFQYLPTPQKLGQLRGNRFHIVLREVKGSDEDILSAMESLKSNGFVNYFGSQRFGTTKIGTHSIGRELLKSNWEKAINLILAPRDNDHPLLNKCRRTWKQTGDAEEALKALKGNTDSFIEGKLLLGLRNRKTDLVGALAMIPRNMRVLYLHAYQSYIWNHIVSKRIAKYGLKVLKGDIIRRKETKDLDNEDNVEEDEEENGDGNNTEKDTKSGIDMSNFHILSEEEAETTHITDVLLPLPGHGIEYPHNEIKEWYIQLLEADGLSISALNHHVKSYSVIGGYRRISVQPSDLKTTITYYDDPQAALIVSDLDKLSDSSEEIAQQAEGKNKAVIIEMTLPASTYATMALRELLKMDTSSAATLNTLPPKNPRPDTNKQLDQRHDQYSGGHWKHQSGHKNRGGYHEKRGGYREKRGGYHENRGGYHENRGGYHGRGRGQKRPWKDHHGKGGKKGKFSF